MSSTNNALNVLAEVAGQKRTDPTIDLNTQELLDLWSRHKYVKEKWLTAQEAKDYIDYFYKWLVPMIPLSIENMQDPATLERMLRDEGFLVLTVLTIVSRYMTLKGYGGYTRSIHIHMNFWKDIEGRLEALFLSPRYSQQTSSIDPAYDPVTRYYCLGTIEAVLLLIEWHPRAVHFPAVISHAPLLAPAEEREAESDEEEPGTNKHWKKLLLSTDHKCWAYMKLALAIGEDSSLFQWSEEEITAYLTSAPFPHRTVFLRCQRIRRLLYVHVSLLTARVNKTPHVPENWNTHLYPDSFVARAYDQLTDNTAHQGYIDAVARQELRDEMVSWFWCRLADMTNAARQALYYTPKHTDELIKMNIHLQTMQAFERDLSCWSRDLANCDFGRSCS